MTQEIRDNHVLITASEGYFLANADKSIYGIGLWLGTNDSPDNYQEYPLSDWPKTDDPEIEEPSVEVVKKKRTRKKKYAEEPEIKEPETKTEE